jgi:hypothetical protein
MAENYDGWSPYNFTLNNPICNYDPNGMWVETDTGYNTNDPDEISQFLLRLFGIGPNNQPKDAEQAKDQESARRVPRMLQRVLKSFIKQNVKQFLIYHLDHY